jgi:hypothetical protein
MQRPADMGGEHMACDCPPVGQISFENQEARHKSCPDLSAIILRSYQLNPNLYDACGFCVILN